MKPIFLSSLQNIQFLFLPKSLFSIWVRSNTRWQTYEVCTPYSLVQFTTGNSPFILIFRASQYYIDVSSYSITKCIQLHVGPVFYKLGKFVEIPEYWYLYKCRVLVVLLVKIDSTSLMDCECALYAVSVLLSLDLMLLPICSTQMYVQHLPSLQYLHGRASLQNNTSLVLHFS